MDSWPWHISSASDIKRSTRNAIRSRLQTFHAFKVQEVEFTLIAGLKTSKRK
jgi:hypothetical protein